MVPEIPPVCPRFVSDPCVSACVVRDVCCVRLSPSVRWHVCRRVSDRG